MSVGLRMVGDSHGLDMVGRCMVSITKIDVRVGSSSLGKHGHGIMSRKATSSMVFLQK